ncbi:hypothetical protein PF005_g13536 [Phytophthora fragariae]|uniref:Uncharacterized protein n=1 Tax=Phytophthora fragariae TaxID=53985 RepID=A0A6A3EP03_9STRA|nr:hypothetical protein PF009_g14746 [Phytophthora fragariae]KAE9095473.1 hypothetical protein PF010_g16688 [Phytophthora fragariae]KAE9106445.1 hypothetical protein PF007_g13389 [Phytophthora fragariae]KAE9129177.1 hypothetical protein PF006_g16089 [Phytophthora fragariae]KAE9205107.1 hypothetical protein PF005_g13536 [Phytophthora fragariae]
MSMTKSDKFTRIEASVAAVSLVVLPDEGKELRPSWLVASDTSKDA